jgi:hypothetical protein
MVNQDVEDWLMTKIGKSYDGCGSRGLGSDIVFSLSEGFAWVSWPGTDAMTRLGAYEIVVAAMRDFLSQGEVGERLLNHARRWRRTGQSDEGAS